MKNNILLELLNQNKSNKNDIITHARIGNRDLKIVGGSYNINYNSEELFNKFTKIYCDTVLKKNKYEYLTELQDKENGGPILVDLDFKLKKEEERFLDESTGQELVESYIYFLSISAKYVRALNVNENLIARLLQSLSSQLVVLFPSSPRPAVHDDPVAPREPMAAGRHGAVLAPLEPQPAQG